MEEYRRADGNIARWEVIRNFGTISEGEFWSKEVRLVKFEGNTPYYDIRRWQINSEGQEYPCKGVTLDYDELEELYHILKRMFND